MNASSARIVGLGAALALTVARGANADATAPGLDTGTLHASATTALLRLRPNVQMNDRHVTDGAYVAFDPSTTEVTALAACDDDGDPVIVVTEAMLHLLADLADTAVADVEDGARPAGPAMTTGANHVANHGASYGPGAAYPALPRVDAYATLFAAQASAPSPEGPARPVSPPAGTFDSGLRTNAQSAHLYDAMVEVVVAHELAHLARGDVRCSHPTETHEAADDVWTAAEGANARRMASASYGPERAIDADANAATWMATLHEPRDGATVLLRFFAAVERNNPRAATYLTTHPHAALRLEVFRAAWDRVDHAASAPVSAPGKTPTRAHR